MESVVTTWLRCSKILKTKPTIIEVRTREIRKFALPILFLVTVVALFAFFGSSLFHEETRHETPPINTQTTVVPDSVPSTVVTSDIQLQIPSATQSSDALPIEPWRDGIDQSLKDLNQDIDNLQRLFIEPSPQ
jgi:hypothetical protein